MFWRGELIHESEWMRVYESPEFGRVHESKFLTDRVQVSSDSIIRRWPALSFDERIEFANAFAVKPELTSEDERILEFLMDAGDLYIWMTIAPLLPHHRNRERALAFLLERVKEERREKANFFQALELMRDVRAVPALRAAYENYRSSFRRPRRAAGEPEEPDYSDYLQCCKALWALEGSPQYREAIEELSKSPVSSLRSLAERLLSSG